MIGPDVEKRRNVEARSLEVVQLERRELQDEQTLLPNLVQAAGQGPPGVARDRVRDARSVENVTQHAHDGRLAIGPGNRRDPCVRSLGLE
jgi:hypothetical protein